MLAAVIISGLAPYDAEGLDWFAGIHPEGQAELRAATAGRAALARHLASAGFDPEMFTPADHEALDGRWAWLNDIAGRATAGGPDAMIDDDLASVGPWGFGPRVDPPVLFVHGTDDRMVPPAHSEWLAARNDRAEVWLRPGDGHVSVLDAAPDALRWLRDRA